MLLEFLFYVVILFLNIIIVMYLFKDKYIIKNIYEFIIIDFIKYL